MKQHTGNSSPKFLIKGVQDFLRTGTGHCMVCHGMKKPGLHSYYLFKSA